MRKKFQIITTIAMILWAATTVFFIQAETSKTMNQIVEINKKFVNVVN